METNVDFGDFIELINFLKNKLSEDDFEDAVKLMAEILYPKKDINDAQDLFGYLGESISSNPEGFLNCEYFRWSEKELTEFKKENSDYFQEY